MVELAKSKVKTKKPVDAESINNKKSIYGILGAIAAAFIVFYIIPVGDPAAGELSAAARGLITVFVVALILWTTEALPVAVTSLLILIISPFMGVFKDIKGAAVGFTSSVIYFVIATFILSIAVERSGIGKRFALWLITRAGTGSRTALFVFMFGCGVVSSIMSNVPACAIWMSLALPILKKIDARPGFSNLGKAMMIGIPFASFIGGIATPAGSSINILALSLLKEKTGIDVTFIQWMSIGIPLFLVMIVASWWILVKLIPPEVDSIGSVEDFKKEQDELGNWSTIEKKTIIILCIMIALWISSSWIKQIDITTIAIAGSVVMFLPGIKLFTWGEVQKSIAWDSILMIGSVTSLGLASSDTGLSNWVVVNTMGGIGEWPIFAAILIISIFIVFVHLPIPVNPTIVAAFTPAMVVLASTAGVSPVYFTLAVAFTASCAFLLPLDAVTLITYSKGYYKMFDMFIPGVIISMVWVLVITALLVFVGPIVGF
jgi:solute carrier family 13 (sodium-dependent dicarboxylate transporter), member 2/3/5